MIKFHFSLARKQVFLSIALIVFTLLPLGFLIYHESVENIQNAYSQAIESSLENAEKSIIQNWREQNVIRSLHIEKIKNLLRDMAAFTAYYIEYLIESDQPIKHIQRSHDLTLPYNINFYLFDKNGDLYAQNVPHNSHSIYSMSEVTPLSMSEIDDKLKYANNDLFYVTNGYPNQEKTVLLHLQKLSLHDFYLITSYNLKDIKLNLDDTSSFLHEVLKENVTIEDLLIGGFFFAYDTLENAMLTQSKTDIEIPTKLINNVLENYHDESVFRSTFTYKNLDYLCQFNYLQKEHILLGAVFSKAQIAKSTNESMYNLLYFLLMILIMGSLLAFYFGKTLMRPLASLRNMAEKIPQLDFNSTPELIEELPLERNDEIGDLARTFSEIQSLLYENVKNLMEVQGKNERINAELNAARDMQMGLLPTNFPKFSYTNDYNLNAMCIPAREVGGDLYDFFMIDEEHLCFHIGDVSGKGMSAAFFMSIASTLIQVNIKQFKDVKKVTEILNNQLCERNPENLFLTLFLAIYNIHTGQLTYTSAGHLPALILDKNTQKYLRVENPNFILGLMPNMEYEAHHLKIDNNQMLYIYTDGITEAINEKRIPEEKFFGEERLQNSLTCLTKNLFTEEAKKIQKDNDEAISKDLLKNIINNHIDEIYTFCDGTQQADDITCLALYRP